MTTPRTNTRRWKKKFSPRWLIEIALWLLVALAGASGAWWILQRWAAG